MKIKCIVFDGSCSYSESYSCSYNVKKRHKLIVCWSEDQQVRRNRQLVWGQKNIPDLKFEILI